MSIMHASVAIHSRGRLVDIIGASVTGATGGSGFAAYYDITSGGQERTAINNGAASPINTWLLSGAAADYEIRLTPISGSFGGSAVNTWLSLSASRAWTLAAGVMPASINGTLEIRLVSTGEVLDSAGLTLARVA